MTGKPEVSLFRGEESQPQQRERLANPGLC
jgi:hypothetical protein